jgi:predicted nucleotidyltransferase
MKSTAMGIVSHGGLSPETLKKLGSVLRSHPAVEQIILFGSRAINRHQHSSDIDLALKGTQLNFSNLLQLKSAIDDLMLPYKVDLVIYETIQNKDLKEHIDQVGIALW